MSQITLRRRSAGTPRSTSRSAFTLIELLVVIAIIAILAAILFPVFATAREKARQTTCLSNIKQIGLSIMMYTQDFDENYPLQSDDAYGQSPYAIQDSPNRMSWMGGVQPYLKSLGIMACPSTPLKTAAGDSVPTTYSRCSYAYNGLLGHILPTDAQPNPLPIGTIAGVSRPSDTMMLEDVGWTWSRSQPQPRWISGQWCNAIASVTVTQIHNGTMNIGYADGHAKAIHATDAAANLYPPYPSSANFCLGNGATGTTVTNLNSIYNPYRQ